MNIKLPYPSGLNPLATIIPVKNTIPARKALAKTE
jgi:hypothetical protein